MAIAEHEPSKLNPANRGLLSMSHQQLHEFADTKEAGLPERKGSMISARRKKV